MTTAARTIALRLRLQAVRVLNGDPVDGEFLVDLAEAFEAADALEGELGRVVRDAVARLEGTAER